MSLDELHTERLTAERLRAAHLGALCRMHRDPQVMATLGGERSDEQTQQFLREQLEHWDRHGFGLWVFRTRAEGQFVGRGGLRRVEAGGHDEVELLYALLDEFWDQGLATEMAAAILPVAFEQLRLPSVVAFTLPHNQASRRVLEKVGFVYERDIVHAGRPHVLYRLTDAQWAKR